MRTKEPVYAICPACREEFEIVRGRKIPVHNGGGFDDCAGSGRPAAEGIALWVKEMVEHSRRTIDNADRRRESLREALARDLARIDEDVARAESFLARNGGKAKEGSA